MAARNTGASERYIQYSKRIKREAPDLAKEMSAGTLSIAAANRELRERDGKPPWTDAQARRLAMTDQLAIRLVDAVDDDVLTVERAGRMLDLWVKYGDG